MESTPRLHRHTSGKLELRWSTERSPLAPSPPTSKAVTIGTSPAPTCRWSPARRSETNTTRIEYRVSTGSQCGSVSESAAFVGLITPRSTGSALDQRRRHRRPTKDPDRTKEPARSQPMGLHWPRARKFVALQLRPAPWQHPPQGPESKTQLSLATTHLLVAKLINWQKRWPSSALPVG